MHEEFGFRITAFDFSSFSFFLIEVKKFLLRENK